jgi:hypothetical protein
MFLREQLEQIELDDLARYSVWPKRLLSAVPFAAKSKTEAEVLREFEAERWGDLLRKVRALKEPTLAEVEHVYTDINAVAPCFEGGKFYLASWRQTQDRYLARFAEVLGRHVPGASALVELGAGYGSKLLGLGRLEEFADLPLYAAEFTQSGRELISILARAMKREVGVGHCDFRTLALEPIGIPEGAVIFTSYAAMYVPELSNDFTTFLAQLKPKAVVHFEPCYEHYDETSVHGLMCRRYIELNDYTRNLASVIDNGAGRDGFSVQVCRNVMGSNAFLPMSIIEWTPA